MSEDRKRLVISIGAAVLLHIVVLILTGMNKPDYGIKNDYGPITVEISLDKPPVEKPPEPEIEHVRTFEAEAAPPVVEETAEPAVSAAPVPVPQPQVKKPAAARQESSPKSYVPAAPDDSFIEILKQRSSTGGIDARSVFGDDPVPSSTTRTNAPSAAGALEGSEVFLSDSRLPVNDEPKLQPQQPSEMSVIEAGDLKSLDRKLSTGGSEVSPEQNSAETTSSEIKPSSSEVAGQSRSLKFENPALSRRLLSWSPPEIPSEVQTAGISKYTVVIEFDIDNEGLTSGFHIRQTSADTRIDAAVQKVLREWVFEESSSTEVKKVRAILTYVIEIK